MTTSGYCFRSGAISPRASKRPSVSTGPVNMGTGLLELIRLMGRQPSAFCTTSRGWSRRMLWRSARARKTLTTSRSVVYGLSAQPFDWPRPATSMAPGSRARNRNGCPRITRISRESSSSSLPTTMKTARPGRRLLPRTSIPSRTPSRSFAYPGFRPKGDVSDWLDNHTAKELEAEIAKAPNWKPACFSRPYPMFQDAVQFAAEAEATVDWLIEGIIPRAGNGIIGGHPKASKSFHALDLAMAASCGVPGWACSVPKPHQDGRCQPGR